MYVRTCVSVSLSAPSSYLVEHVVVAVSLILEEAVRNPQVLIACHVDVGEVAELGLMREAEPIVKPFLLEAKLRRKFLQTFRVNIFLQSNVTFYKTFRPWDSA